MTFKWTLMGMMEKENMAGSMHDRQFQGKNVFRVGVVEGDN